MRYRKIPAIIEARLLTTNNFKDIAKWCNGIIIKDGKRYYQILIHTLERDRKADIGDYIIKGVKGDFYPIKDDIFKETYERVD